MQEWRCSLLNQLSCALFNLVCLHSSCFHVARSPEITVARCISVSVSEKDKRLEALFVGFYNQRTCIQLCNNFSLFRCPLRNCVNCSSFQVDRGRQWCGLAVGVCSLLRPRSPPAAPSLPPSLFPTFRGRTTVRHSPVRPPTTTSQGRTGSPYPSS